MKHSMWPTYILVAITIVAFAADIVCGLVAFVMTAFGVVVQ